MLNGTTTTFEATHELDAITPVDYGSTTVAFPIVYASVQPAPVAEMTLKCSCRAELKLTNYAIPAALDYGKEWWKAHKDCG